MPLITAFDPWRSSLCTCPPKLTLNPYTGCDHACIYCYASSYIPRFFNCRPKKNLIQRLEAEATKLKGELIGIANSSDPYPRLEADIRLTRQCLQVLSEHNCKAQVITKSNLVERDSDVLAKFPSMVSLTITTCDDGTGELLEPGAPSPSERLKTVDTLIRRQIPVSVRIDPIIPFVNDNTETVVKTLASIGVKHITASTYKVRSDNWRRLTAKLPILAEKLKPLYFEKGEKKGRCLYLPGALRLNIMRNVATAAKRYAMKVGTCREDMGFLTTASCDGSWLLSNSVR